jgi:lipoprotein-anchoring transpeptidase ErfK/SrfK
MIRVNGNGAAIVAGRLWRVAILTASGAIGITSQAQAALYYWSDSDPALSRPEPAAPQPRQGKRRHSEKKAGSVEKESAKPQGPLIISISIAQQRMRIYDANGLFAETPVSTGMPGHPTPMGVFSVIQKHKFHHSNIYSGAPMPYMQRITWSGVAMHAGVLPGRPASHGCIRMPMAFAVKMWNWTRMGARVVVTPGEITPISFSHPLLAALKVPPQPTATDEPKQDAPIAAKADKMADAAKPVIEPAAELRSTLGHDDRAKSAADETRPSAPPQTRTADASDTSPAANLPVTMSDAAPASGNATSAPEKREEAASSDDKAADEQSADAKSSEVTSAEIEPAKADAIDVAEKKVDEAASSAAVEAVTIETAAGESIKADAAKTDAPKAVETPSEKPGESAQAVAAPAALPETKKDQTRPTEVVKAAAPKPDPAPAAASRRSGQIAVFVSRKDSKLYVRQNFAPLFDAPVTFAPSDRPLGTHVFTAQVDKDDANVLHWSVVSLPAPTRYADRRDEDDRSSRRRKIAGAGPIEVKTLPAPDSPAEALDRLTLPADAMARITEALSTGGSIIVSDQGIAAGETGEGTDFIVSLR